LPTLANLKGCTQKPLFAAVPISNYIAPVLHLVIGIGNILVDSIFEWVEQIVEQLTEEEVVARNNILSAEINIKNSECYFNEWLEKCFVKFGIDHPYYHGGKCNGKAMVKLLTKADEVMEAVKADEVMEAVKTY